MEILIFLVMMIILVVLYCYHIYRKNYYSPQEEDYQTENTEQNNRNNTIYEYDYNYMPYTKRALLTKTEKAFFLVLVKEALKRRLLVCPKVRLEDIIYVTDRKNRNKYRGYIKSRHIDFVLLNSNCEAVAAIELDDPSHNTRKAAQADQFKNNLFYKVGIPLIRIYVGVDYIKEINYAFDNLQFPKTPIQKTTAQQQVKETP